MSWFQYILDGYALPNLRIYEQALIQKNTLLSLLNKDPAVWSDSGLVETSAVHCMDWLDSGLRSAELASNLVTVAAESCSIVLIGMGGASLSATAYACSPKLGSIRNLQLLDSTSPDAIAKIYQNLHDSHRHYVVCSKSGSTIETFDLARSLFERVGSPEKFTVVTDQTDSPLRSWASAREIQLYPSDRWVGGRFSAFSNLALIPSRMLGIDVHQILHWVSIFTEKIRQINSESACQIIRLASLLAAAVVTKRHYLVLWATPSLTPILQWVEQLVAESLGKFGLGVLPIFQESKLNSDALGNLQIAFRQNCDDNEATLAFQISNLKQLTEFFLGLSLAVVMAGLLLKIDPFNQPDVERSKQLLYKKLPKKTADASRFINKVSKIDNKSVTSIESLIDQYRSSMAPNDYLCLLVYCNPDTEISRLLFELAGLICKSIGRSVLYCYGPQYLHSTGQFHKGGWESGHFLLIRSEQEHDFRVINRPYTFSQLFNTQASADAATLMELGKRVDTIWLNQPLKASLKKAINNFQNSANQLSPCM